MKETRVPELLKNYGPHGSRNQGMPLMRPHNELDENGPKSGKIT
jgi:hypothetical protein